MSQGEAPPEEPAADTSHISVFVHQADSYLGRHLVGALQEASYTVYGDKVRVGHFATPNYTPVPEFEAVGSIDDAFALCNTFVFDIRESPEVALQAFSLFEAATTNVKVILISTLMTWALTPTSSALTGDDFRKRRPHPNFKTQYEAELKATKLCRENPLIDVYILSCGIPYGAGEDLLFQLFKFAWGLQYNEAVGIRTTIRSLPLIGDGENVIPMIHVKDLAQLMISTLKGQMIDRFVMAVDKGNNKLKEVIEAISKAFGNGQYEKITADHALTLPFVTETLIDYFTVDISAVNELLGRVKTTNAAGFVASIDQVKTEFLDGRGVHPLRILVCGPPLSGKTYVASRLSYRCSLPLITVDSLVAEAKKNEHNYWQQFANQVQGEISPALLLELLKWKLLEFRCKNQGFVLDGIPSNSDFAEALWQDGTSLPQVFIELECQDSFLRDRARQDPSMMLGIGNTDEFDARLLQYRATNPADDSHLFYFFDPATTRGITVNVEKQKDNLVPVISAFVGRPHNFGKQPGLVIRHTEEMNRQKRLKQERLSKLESEIREAEEAKKREKELLITRQQELIEQEETRLLAKFSKPQREWLVKTVAPTLAEGLCYVIKEMPDDPIQLLGCFVGTTLPQDQQAELVHEFQPEEEEDGGYEEEDDADEGDQPI
jgi:adenylate kinase